MNTLIGALKEIYGLFVENGSYAAAICVWLIFVAFVLPVIGVSHVVQPLVFVCGLVVILVENVIRSARNRPAPK